MTTAALLPSRVQARTCAVLASLGSSASGEANAPSRRTMPRCSRPARQVTEMVEGGSA